MKPSVTTLFAVLISVATYANFSVDTINLPIKAFWLDGEKIEIKDSISISNEQCLVIELPIIKNAIYYYNQDTAGTEMPFIIYAQHKKQDYTFQAVVKNIEGTIYKTPTLKIHTASRMIMQWWFVVGLFFYLAFLTFAAGYLIIINRNRGLERLADLRVDWTNKLHNDIGGDLSGLAMRVSTLKKKLLSSNNTVEN
ncbi:MAG: hypothetical protein HC912_04975, partial [Saprospiraceae bacterium]|nr:hypothetical protein [Saprospiraceae bacterium]